MTESLAQRGTPAGRYGSSLHFKWLLIAAAASVLLFGGCFIVRPIAGADIDITQLQKAREARMMQVRLEGAQQLADRLAHGGPIGTADLSFYLSEALLNKAAAQLDSASGWLDSTVSYTIRSVRVKLHNGSAIATISLAAYHHGYDVNVHLVMDCAMSFSIENGIFAATLEPFNVVPNVKASGIIASMEGVIRDILTMRLSALADQLPPIRVPVDFRNEFPVQANRTQVRSGINLDITTPAQTLSYTLALKEVLIVNGSLIIALNVHTTGVK